MPRSPRPGLLPRIILLTLVLLVPSLTRGIELEPNLKAGIQLLKEGDELADQGKPTEAVVRYKTAFEHLLPGLRKLSFKHEVKRDVTRREQLKELLLKEIDQDLTPEEFRANELAMKAFGLIPPSLDLKALLVQVYSEEIAAFYDPKTKTMHLIEEPEPDAQKKPSFLERLLGKRGGFDKDENKSVIAHELTHALADQHYDLEGLHAAAKHDDDRALAVSALIEGEATLAMMGAGMDDWEGVKVVKMPAEDLERSLDFITPFLSFMGGKSLKSAPPIIAETMTFPYFRGMVFCAKLTNNDGWKAVDKAYRDPPVSTEQILHPDKFLSERDDPTLLDLGTFSLGPQWQEVGRNVLGELQIAIMLRRYQGKEAAAGWDGDRYAVFEGPGGKLGLVWVSTWDHEKDAQEFAQSYVRYQSSRMPGDWRPPRRIPDALWRCQDGVCWIVERRGSDVVVVEGFGPAESDRAVEAAFAAEKLAYPAADRVLHFPARPRTESNQSPAPDVKD
jgi:hypothetical protein